MRMSRRTLLFSPAGTSPEVLAIVQRLAAALNRSTLLTDPTGPTA